MRGTTGRFVVTGAAVLAATVALAGTPAGALRAVDDAHRPIRGARLVCVEPGGDALVLAVAGDDGRLAPAAFPRGSCRVEADGYVPRSLARDSSTGEEIVLLRAASIEGQVLLPDGRPAAHVQVEAPGCVGDLRVALTDRDGRFRLGGLDPGRTVLEVTGEGLLPGRLSVPTWPGVTARVTVGACVPAHVRFVGPEGSPRAVRRVRIEVGDRTGRTECLSPGGRPLLPLEAGGDAGRRSFGPVPAGDDLVAMVVADDCAPVRRALRLGPGENRVTLSCPPAAILAGRLVDSEGKGLEGVRLRISSPDPGTDALLDLGDLRETTTAAGGGFSFPGLPGGAYRLSIPGADERLPALRVRLRAGERKVLGDLVALPAGSITVRVLDPGGEPVEGAVVRACPIAGGGCPWRARARTDGSGEAVLRGLRPGPWRVEAKAEGFLPVTRDGLRPGEGADEVEIVLARGGILGGILLDEGARPVPLARLALREAGAIGDPEATRSVHPEEGTGTFRWEGAPPGTWYVVVRAPGRGSAVVRDVVVRAGEETWIGEVFLERGQVVEGRVTDPEGTPVVSAEVGLRERGGEVAPELLTWTDGEGRFELGGLPPEGTLLVRAPGFAPALSRYRTTPGETLPWKEIVLDRGGTLEGRATGPGGEPLAGARVSVEGVGLRTWTDGEGEYVLEHVPPGRWFVSLAADPQRPELITERREVTVHARGERVHLDFDLETTLRGHVLCGEDAVPWAAVTGVKAGEQPVVRSIEADGEGRYELPGISAGSWTLLVDLPGGCRWREPFSLPPASDARRSEEHDIHVPPGRLRGVVLDDETGRPVPGARVTWTSRRRPGQVTYRWPLYGDEGGYVVAESDPRAGAEAVTGTDGTFELCVPGEGRVHLVAGADGPFEDLERDLELPPREALVELRLPRKGNRVRVRVPSAAGRDSCMLVVEREGHYEVRPLDPQGEAVVDRPGTRFRAWAGCAGSLLGRTRWIDPGEEIGEALVVDLAPVYPVVLQGFGEVAQRLQEAKDPGEVSFQVLDGDGEEIFRMGMATGAIRLVPGSTPGDVVLEGLPAGRARIRIAIGGRVLVDEEVAVGEGSPVIDVSLPGD